MRRRGWLLSQISTVLLVLAAVAWLLFLRPEPLGGSTTYVIVSGVSMEPTLQNGDFVIARRQADYEVGDIVVYAVPEGDVGAGSRIIHRIIDKEPDGFVIQGDNPDITVPDIWRPAAPEIEGKLLVAVPAVGRYLPLLRSPLILGLLAGAFVFWVMYPSKERDTEDPEPVPDLEVQQEPADSAPDEELSPIFVPVSEPAASQLAPAGAMVREPIREDGATAEASPPLAARAPARGGAGKLVTLGAGAGFLTFLIWRHLRSR